MKAHLSIIDLRVPIQNEQIEPNYALRESAFVVRILSIYNICLSAFHRSWG